MKRVEWANALRGIAALSVIFFHFAVLFWVRQDVTAGLARRNPLWAGDTGAPLFARAVRLLSIDFGAFGVSLFFLISGYVIAISLDRYNRCGFIVGRCMRVLPTYAAGYLITCAVIWLASDPNHEISLRSVLTGMIPGLSFLSGTSVPADGIVWTLLVELVFYVVCLAAYRTLANSWLTIAAIAAACGVIQWGVQPIPLGTPWAGLVYVTLLACPFLPVMLIGVVLSAHNRDKLPSVQAAILVPILATIFGLLAWNTAVVPTPVAYRSTFFGTIALFTAICFVGSRWRRHPAGDFLSDISYPLYVVHPVLGYFLLSIMVTHGIWAPLAIVGTIAVVVATAWVLHKVVESPTHQLGQQWARRISSLSASAPVRL